MSHFYGIVKGVARTPATRRGTSASGLTTRAASWAGAIEVVLWTDDTGTDRYDIRCIPWAGAGDYFDIAQGVVGKGPWQHSS